MGRKKKRKGRNKKRQSKAAPADQSSTEDPSGSGAEPTPAESAPEAEDDPVAVDLDEEEAAEAEDDVVVLDLDDDTLDAVDPDERERLIAATMALVDDDDRPVESGVGDAAGPTSEDQTPNEPPAPDPYRVVEQPDPDAAAEAGAAATVPPPDRELVITRDAVAALSEIHEEGLASLPAELVLELGEATSEEERDRILRAALAHAEMQEAIYRVPTEVRTVQRLKGAAAAVLFVMAMLAWASPPSLLVPDPGPQLTSADRARGVRLVLLVQAQQIEAFRVREARLPTSLAETALELPDVRYVRSSNRLYQLIAYLPDGRAVVYDTAAPDPAFAALVAPGSEVGRQGS